MSFTPAEDGYFYCGGDCPYYSDKKQSLKRHRQTKSCPNRDVNAKPRYWCEDCNIGDPYPGNFKKHLQSKIHNAIVNKIQEIKRKPTLKEILKRYGPNELYEELFKFLEYKNNTGNAYESSAYHMVKWHLLNFYGRKYTPGVSEIRNAFSRTTFEEYENHDEIVLSCIIHNINHNGHTEEKLEILRAFTESPKRYSKSLTDIQKFVFLSKKFLKMVFDRKLIEDEKFVCSFKQLMEKSIYYKNCKFDKYGTPDLYLLMEDSGMYDTLFQFLKNYKS